MRENISIGRNIVDFFGEPVAYRGYNYHYPVECIIKNQSVPVFNCSGVSAPTVACTTQEKPKMKKINIPVAISWENAAIIKSRLVETYL
jgi:hypothetical protein